MIGELKPYENYRNSRIPWLGQIPEHWNLQRLDKLFVLRKEEPLEGDQRVTGYLDGRVTLRSNVKSQKIKGVIKEAGWQRIHPGDFAISGMNAHLGGMGVSDSLGKCSPIYLVLEPKPTTNAYFVSRVVRRIAHSGALKTLVNTIRYNSADLKRGDLKNIYVWLPPVEEQAAIAHFLNYADRRIRRYIRTKQKLIKLLEEQTQSVINEAVTRGCNTESSSLISSGVDWVGDIPKHWAIVRVKQVSNILRGKFSHRPRNDPDFYDGPYPFIQTGDVARAVKKITEYKQTLNERGLLVSKQFPAGTLVMTIAANIGDVAVLDFEACFPDSIVGFVPKSCIDRDYLYYVFKAMKSELLREAPVNTQGNLNVDRVGCRGIPLPPVSEQVAIVQYILQKTRNLGCSITHTKKEIELLREFRTCLIADVVTGKLDVREAAAKLPAELETLEPSDPDLTENDIVLEDDLDDFDEPLEDEVA